MNEDGVRPMGADSVFDSRVLWIAALYKEPVLSELHKPTYPPLPPPTTSISTMVLPSEPEFEQASWTLLDP